MKLIDQADRERAVDELDRSFLVEAGAGTGKTTILVQRLVHLVARGTPVSRIVAITFTEKAAAELKIRFRDELERQAGVHREGGDSARADRLAAAVEQLENAEVTTIHGFCSGLLRERPVEAGVDPGFEVADGDVQKQLLDETVNLFLDQVALNEPEGITQALEAGLTLEDLRGLIRNLIQQRDLLQADELEILPAAVPDPGALREQFGVLVRELQSSVDGCKEDDDRGRLQIDELSRLECSLVGLSDAAAARAIATRAPSSGKGNKKHWPKGVLEQNKQLIAEFGDIVERYTRALLNYRAEALLGDLVDLPQLYDAVKERRCSLDFQDLLLRARDLLRDDREVRRYFQRAFSAILVDEFQDTDPLQAEIAFFLAEDPRSEPVDDWASVRIGPGRLFLVGDPKQSIYRFRRADIEIYEKARDLILASGGDVLTIRVNFRSTPGILRWVNDRFEQLIRRPEDGQRYQPDYVPIDSPSDGSDGATDVLLLTDSTADQQYARVGPARLAEANAIAAYLKRVVEGGAHALRLHTDSGDRMATYRDCAILFRTTTALELYENALRAHAVPYRVSAGKHLYSRIEVKAAVALFRALDDPQDEVAMVATLRGPLFGVSDVDLAAFRGAGGVFGRLGEDPKGTPDSIAAARAVLKDLRRRRYGLGLAEFVSLALRRTRAIELFHIKPMGEQRVANLLKFVDLARRLEATERKTFRSFVEIIAVLEKEGGEDAEAALLDDGDDSVQLLTMHKSKGLEFPLVVLADLSSGGNRHDPFLSRRGPPVRIEFVLGAKERRVAATVGFEELQRWDVIRADAERRRLFYVAATRARSRLVLPRFRAKGVKGGFLHLLQGDPLYEASAADATGSVVELGDLDARPASDRPFRLKLTSADELPGEARAILAERQQFHSELSALFCDPRHGMAVSSATAEKDAVDHRWLGTSDQPEEEPETWRGKQFGTLVHRLFEQVDFRAPNDGLEQVSRNLAVQEQLPGEAAAEAVELVLAFLSTDLAERLRSARRIDSEVPFVFRDAGGALLEGAIDLLAEESEGRYLIVDWKTDAVESDHLDQRLDGYRSQGETYARAVRAATGGEVTDVIFAFVRAGVTRSVK